MFFWSRAARRRRLLAEPFPLSWQRLLERVPYYHYLSPDQRAKLRDDVRVFIAEREWFGCGGLEITDEMRVIIAAQACLLVIGITPTYHYERIKSIVIHPTEFRARDFWNGVVVGSAVLAGAALHRSPIVLAWNDVLRNIADPHGGENLVFHEFAHHLDGLDGDVDGTPPLESKDQYRHWERVTEREFAELKQAVHEGRQTLLDPYGATNRAEFFTVTTECFFTRGADLRREHPELYQALHGFYRQDPAAWATAVDQRRAPPRLRRRSEPWRVANYHAGVPANVEAADDVVRELNLKPGTADAEFSIGVVYFNRRQYDEAVRAFSEALKLKPDDSEVLRHRGIAHLRRGKPAEAIEDLNAALAIDAGDLDAYRARAEAKLMSADYAGALDDVAWPLRNNWRDAAALRIRGLALAAQGQLNKGIAVLTSAIHADPNQAETYAARSHLLELAGKPDRAERDRVEALRRDPRLASVLSSDETQP